MNNYYSMQMQNESHLKDIQRERQNIRLAKLAQPQKSHTPARSRLVAMLVTLLSRF